MRVGMGLIKNEYGVYHVRRKVPKGLEAATATVMGVPKERVSWLKETLGTKAKQAKVLATPVMMKFDGILAQAEALLVEQPVRTELTEAEIKRIADYFYAHSLVRTRNSARKAAALIPSLQTYTVNLQKRGSSSKHRSRLPKALVRACRTV
jgi:hypothetical protein